MHVRRTSLALLSAFLIAGLAACDQANEGAENPPPPSEEPEVQQSGPDMSADPEDAPADAAEPEGEETAEQEAGGEGPAYVGLWAAEAEWCANEPGSSDTAPIAIREDGLSGLENECSFSEVSETRGIWRATMSCIAEGQEEEERISMAPSAERMVLTYHSRGAASAYQRCEE